MTKNCSKPETWLKCYSKNKNMIYYYNPNTSESLWDQDSVDLLKRDDIEIIDKSIEMRNVQVNKPKTGSPTKVNGTLIKPQAKSKTESEEDDDDDAYFNDTIFAHREMVSNSSTSICSLGSSSNCEYEKRNSGFIPKSSVLKKTVDGKKTAETPSPKAPPTTRPVLKFPINQGNKSSSDLSSTRPVPAKTIGVKQPTLIKKDLLKPSQKRSKTPIQDRKMKEKEELLLKQKQRCSVGAPLPGNSQPGSKGEKKFGNFVIPRRKVPNSTPDQASERESLGSNQRLTTQITQKTPLQVTALPNKNTSRTIPQRESLGSSQRLTTQKTQPTQQLQGTAVHNKIITTTKTLPVVSVNRNTRKRRSDSDSENSGIRKLKTGNDSGSSVSVSSKRTRMSSETLSETPTGPNPIPTRPSSVAGSATFDARQLLNQRRRGLQNESLNKPSCSNEDNQAMDWETIESKQECTSRSVKERLGQPSLAQTATLEMKNHDYKPVVIVCDTNILIHYMDLVEEMLSGFLLSIPVTLVVPYKVFRELDNLQHHEKKEISELARKAIRMINDVLNSRSSSRSNLVVQPSKIHREVTLKGLELEKNDDFVLNCAVQQKKAHGDKQTVILLTADKHLQVLASEHVIQKCPATLKGWAREYKENVRLQAIGIGVEIPQSSPAKDLERPSEMDVDPDPSPIASSTMMSTSVSSSQTEKSSTINTCIKFYADSVNYDLKQFLEHVIKKANENLYGTLKNYASQPKQSWTLVQYIQEVVRRWSALTQKRLTPEMNENIKIIIELVKKYNKGKEDFLMIDMKRYFTCCQSLAKEFKELYSDLYSRFSTRLSENREEFESKSQSLKGVSLCDEDYPQSADMALQNIYTCMRSDYGMWKNKVEMELDESEKLEFQKPLHDFYNRLIKMLHVINCAMEEDRSSLTVHNKSVINFLKQATVYPTGGETYMTFEVTKESIVTLLKEDKLRKGVEILGGKIRILQSSVADLLDELNSSDSDFV